MSSPAVTSRRFVLAALLALPALGLGQWSQPFAQEAPVEIPPPATDLTESGTSATAIFAGGCFWGCSSM